MFLLFPKTTFKQIQVDGRFFQTCFSMVFYHPKHLRIEIIQVDGGSAFFCQMDRDVWFQMIFVYTQFDVASCSLLVHMELEPPPIF